MKKIILGVILLCSTPGLAAPDQTRTFSCNGVYDGSGSDFPMFSISAEAVYAEAKEAEVAELRGEDSKVFMTGSLSIKNNMEFLKIRVKLKESGLVIYNHNSQLGQAANGKFIFVGVWLEEIGSIAVNGRQVFPKTASFQCQSYRN